MDVLERRRVAGTLTYGTLAPHEVEWSRQLHAAAGICDARHVSFSAQFIGYETYLKAARLALYWQHVGRDASFVSPPSAAQTRLAFSFAEKALDLMHTPVLNDYKAFNHEAMLLDEVRHVIQAEAHICSPAQRDALRAAYGRLVASGAIARRSMDQMVQASHREYSGLKAKAKADVDAVGLQPCAHCGAAEVHVAQFKRCAACKDKAIVFCSKECQVANWPQHKAACKAARKAAAGAAAGA